MFKCEYCGNSFKREGTLATHMCAKKKRMLQKNDKNVVVAFASYNYWYKIAMGSKKDKTYADFVDSQYYAAFVRFGTYVLDVKVVNKEAYIRWLVENKIKLDYWAKDKNYNNFLISYSKTETASRALERFVLLADAWAESKGLSWHDYLTRAPAHVIVNDISMGKISPWIIYSSDTFQRLLDELPEEMLKQIIDTLDPAFWNRKTKLFPDDVKFINDTIG